LPPAVLSFGRYSVKNRLTGLGLGLQNLEESLVCFRAHHLTSLLRQRCEHESCARVSTVTRQTLLSRCRSSDRATSGTRCLLTCAIKILRLHVQPSLSNFGSLTAAVATKGGEARQSRATLAMNSRGASLEALRLHLEHRCEFRYEPLKLPRAGRTPLGKMLRQRLVGICGTAEKSQGSPAARFFFKNR
jgi:hypothetical protein